MAQYDAFINLQISKKGQTALDKLEGQINRITGRKQTGAGRTRGAGGGRGSTTAEVKLEANRKRQADRTIATKKVTRRLGDQIQRLNEAGFKTDKLRARLREAGRNADKGKIEAARADNKILKDDINLLQKKLKAEKAIVKQRQLANPLNLKNRQKGIRAGFQNRIDLLEAKGGNVGPLRKQMGQITDAANRPAFRNPFSGDVIKGAVQPGTLQRENDLMDRLIKKEEFKLKIDREQAKQTERELKANQKIVAKLKGATGFKASEYGPQLPGVPQYLPTAPTGEYSNIASGRSFGTEGNRTFLNNPFAKAMQGLGAKKGFDVQSAMISGAFPLLFGQGPLTAAAGAVGGGVGGMFGQMGGFAGGLAATAAVSAIQQAISATAKLGQAFNEFNLDVNAITKSLGVTGTATSQYLKTLEAVKGPMAAANEAQERLKSIIGEKGVADLKEFGERSQSILNSTQKFFTQMTAGLANILNWADKILGISSGLKQRDIRKFGMTDDDEELVRLRGELKALGKNKATRRDDAPFNAKFAEIDARAKQVMTGQTQKDFINNATAALDSNIEKLEKTLSLGTREAGIQQEIASILKEKNILRNDENQEAIDLIEKGVRRKTQLEEQIQLWGQIKDIIAGGLTNAITGLIEGTKTLGQSLADIAKQIANLILQKAILSAVDKAFTFGSGGVTTGETTPVNKFATGRRITNYATGGMATKPTIALVAEAGEDEYIIPASKMASSMQRYSAGARGEAVIPGTGSSYAGGGAGGSTTVNYSGPILNFNSEEFVPKSAVGQIIATATSRGAKAGEARTLSSLQNSRSRRATLGL